MEFKAICFLQQRAAGAAHKKMHAAQTHKDARAKKTFKKNINQYCQLSAPTALHDLNMCTCVHSLVIASVAWLLTSRPCTSSPSSSSARLVWFLFGCRVGDFIYCGRARTHKHTRMYTRTNKQQTPPKEKTT